MLSEKLSVLADAAKYDASCASSGSRRGRKKDELGNTNGVGICHSYTPDGRCVSLLKILLTNYCVYDCLYCVNRVSSDVKRARFTVEEVVQLTIGFYKRNYIEGLFLSSGILKSPDYTSELLTEVAKRLRNEERFAGYIHLKAAPGTSQEVLDEMSKWCDRVSANIELPTEAGLEKIAPAKTHSAVQSTMRILKDSIRSRKDEKRSAQKKRSKPKRFGAKSQSTQMIVGATSASDQEILNKAATLYSDYGLSRVYYSSFSPIPFADPILPAIQTPLIREHRLYQADWLQRFYGFSVEELFSDEKSNLDQELDPKSSWALKNRNFFPVDVNRSSWEQLMRVPGFGKTTVSKIIKARRFGRVNFQDLKRMRVPLNKARFFIATAEPNPALRELDSPRLHRHFVKPEFEQLSLPLVGQAGSPVDYLSALSGEL